MSSTELKKSIGKIVIRINSESIDLLNEYKKVKEGGTLSNKGEVLQKGVIEKKKYLEEALTSLENKLDYVQTENLQKTLQLIKDSIETAETVLERSDINVKKIETANQDAQTMIDNMEIEESQARLELESLTKNLSSLNTNSNVSSDSEEFLNNELATLGAYDRDRFNKIKNVIIKKIDTHREELVKKWKEGIDIIDHQVLKELRSELDATHRQLNHKSQFHFCSV